jgi:hypothetical protein
MQTQTQVFQNHLSWGRTPPFGELKRSMIGFPARQMEIAMSKPKKPLRKAPAYQEYAADVLANAQFRLMTLSERGLLDTIRRECWVNGSVPMQPTHMAKYLGFTEIEISKNLTRSVLSFFDVAEDGNLRCPELDLYREMLNTRHKALSDGGGAGGRKTQENIRSRLKAEARLEPLSKDEDSSDEVRGEKFINGDKGIREWLEDYDKNTT